MPVRIGAGSGAASVKDYVDPLNAYLLAQHAAGRNNLLIVDEAQNPRPKCWSNCACSPTWKPAERKLLQVVLIRQPELRDMLARPELEQLAQRVIARYHLGAFVRRRDDAVRRAPVAWRACRGPFCRWTAPRCAACMPSRGVPRRINLVCDRALLGALCAGRGARDG